MRTGIGRGVDGASFTVGRDTWHVHVVHAAEIGGDAFFEIALIGPRTRIVTVRAEAAGPVLSAHASWLMLLRLHDWIAAPGETDSDWIELSARARAAAC